MLSSKRYNLNAGPFSLCSGTWYKNSKSYKSSTVTEIGECCLQTCVPTIKECHKLCKDSNNPEACHQTCNDIKESCEYNCMLSNTDLWGINNPIYKATEDVGCGEGYYVPLDKKCVENNKYNILKLCQQNCFQDINTDCTQHCNYSYDLLVNPKNNPLEDAYKKKSVKHTKSAPSSLPYITIFIVLLIVFIIGTFGVYQITK